MVRRPITPRVRRGFGGQGYKIDDVGPIPGGHHQIFLERWKARASSRRVKLMEELSNSPVGPSRQQRLKSWIENLATRELWLEARLEHVRAIRSILKAAVD
jgi:hypothetical protein